MKSTVLIAAIVCIHILHTVAGIPLEGIEQMLIAAHPHS